MNQSLHIFEGAQNVLRLNNRFLIAKTKNRVLNESFLEMACVLNKKFVSLFVLRRYTVFFFHTGQILTAVFKQFMVIRLIYY